MVNAAIEALYNSIKTHSPATTEKTTPDEFEKFYNGADKKAKDAFINKALSGVPKDTLGGVAALWGGYTNATRQTEIEKAYSAAKKAIAMEKVAAIKASAAVNKVKSNSGTNPAVSTERPRKAFQYLVRKVGAKVYTNDPTLITFDLRNRSGQKHYRDEVLMGKHINTSQKIYQMGKKKREECKLKAKDGKLYYANIKNPDGSEKIVDTSKIRNKEKTEFITFVIGEDNNLYIADRHAKYPGSDGFTHASFFQGKPVRFAGLINIKDGKVQSYNDDSGHYWPDRHTVGVHMYNATKILDEMSVLGAGCNLTIHSDEENQKTTDPKEFLKEMEIVTNGKTQYDRDIVAIQQGRKWDRHEYANTISAANEAAAKKKAIAMKKVTAEKPLNELSKDEVNALAAKQNETSQAAPKSKKTGEHSNQVIHPKTQLPTPTSLINREAVDNTPLSADLMKKRIAEQPGTANKEEVEKSKPLRQMANKAAGYIRKQFNNIAVPKGKSIQVRLNGFAKRHNPFKKSNTR